MPFSLENLLIAAFYLGVVGLIVLIAQVLFYFRWVVGEYSRKLIHIATALWMSTWRFELTHLEVTYLCLALLILIFIVKQFNWLNSIFDVERVTYGEFIYVIGIMLTALIFPSPAVYALAVINLGVADGMAAVLGMRYGKKKYDVFGSTKSLVGMASSFTVALITGTLFWIYFVQFDVSILLASIHIISTAAVVSGLEFVSFKGLDNLAIPLATGLLYASLIM